MDPITENSLYYGTTENPEEAGVFLFVILANPHYGNSKKVGYVTIAVVFIGKSEVKVKRWYYDNAIGENTMFTYLGHIDHVASPHYNEQDLLINYLVVQKTLADDSDTNEPRGI